MPRHITCHGKRNPNCTAPYHGTPSAYQRGCRCPNAREADRITRKRIRENRYTSPLIDGTGTARRLQGLNAQGFRLADLAAEPELNCSGAAVWQWATMARPFVHRHTADRVKTLTRRLCDQTGPSEDARARARKRGWVSLVAWNNIDDPTEQPETMPQVSGDRAAQFRQLRSAGANYRHIKAELGLNAAQYRRLAAQAEQGEEAA